MRFARIDNGIAAEIVDLAAGQTPDALFHPEIAAQFVEATNEAAPGWRYSDGVFSAPEPLPVADLAAIKTALKQQIDAQAESERGKYLTAGAGQALTYQRKTQEALDYQAAVAFEEEIDPAHFPMLAASLGIDGETLADVAAVVMAMDAAWAKIGAAIERARLSAKAAIDVAVDEETARAVVPVWPQPPI